MRPENITISEEALLLGDESLRLLPLTFTALTISIILFLTGCATTESFQYAQEIDLAPHNDIILSTVKVENLIGYDDPNKYAWLQRFDIPVTEAVRFAVTDELKSSGYQFGRSNLEILVQVNSIVFGSRLELKGTSLTFQIIRLPEKIILFVNTYRSGGVWGGFAASAVKTQLKDCIRQFIRSSDVTTIFLSNKEDEISNQIELQSEDQKNRIAPNSTSYTDVKEQALINMKSPAELIYDNKVIKIHYGESILYLLNDQKDFLHPDARCMFSAQIPVEFNGKLAINNKFIKIDDQTKIVKFTSKTPKILTVSEDGLICVKDQGKGIFRVSIDSHSVDISLHIEFLPIKYGIDTDRLIEKLGIPDKMIKKVISWPESEIIDGIFYCPGVGGINCVEHWIYNKYPGAIIRIGVTDEVNDVVQKGWEELSSVKWKLEHK